MANNYLVPLYNELFNDNFSYDEFSKRLKMQKAIYLLQELGVPVGDYRFSWYKHGPYSQTLLDDMHTALPSSGMALAADAEQAVLNLKKALIVPTASHYSSEEWAECLGSLHYLKENISSCASSDEALLADLIRRKPHLNDSNANVEALNRIKRLFS